MSALTRFFSGKSSSKTKGSGSSAQRRVSSSGSTSLVPKELTGEVAKNVNRELYQVPMPEQTEGMSDLIKDHKSGDQFQYFSVTGHEEESRPSRLARLRSFMPNLGKRSIPVIKLPALELIDMSSSLSLGLLLPAKKMKGDVQKAYVRIQKITGLFIPVMSSTSKYSHFIATIIDDRFPDGSTVAQSVRGVTNQEQPIELSCDYCVPRSAIGKINLNIDLETRVLNAGEQWGTAYLEINLEESDFPYMAPKREALATVRAPYTTLEQRTVNPDRMDIGYTGTEIGKFREMYERGEIVDSGEAVKERVKASSYAKSAVRSGRATKGKEVLTGVRPGWEYMADAQKPDIPAYEASVSAESREEDEDNGLGGNSSTLQSKRGWQKRQEEMRERAQEERTKIKLQQSESTEVPMTSEEAVDNALNEAREEVKDKRMDREVKVGWKGI